MQHSYDLSECISLKVSLGYVLKLHIISKFMNLYRDNFVQFLSF